MWGIMFCVVAFWGLRPCGGGLGFRDLRFGTSRFGFQCFLPGFSISLVRKHGCRAKSLWRDLSRAPTFPGFQDSMAWKEDASVSNTMRFRISGSSKAHVIASLHEPWNSLYKGSMAM